MWTVLFSSTKAVDFITSADPVRLLTESNELSFEDEESRKLLDSSSTTPEIRALCKDLKVIGKGDFRMLLRWRVHVRPLLVARGEKVIPDATPKVEPDEDELLEEALTQDELRRRREEKKTRREHSKQQRKKDMGLIHEFALDVSEREGPFSLSSIGVDNDDPRLEAVREGSIKFLSLEQF